MKLISFPTDFSPLLADNYFHFEEVDPTVSTEIYFFSSSGEPLGARRYAGRTTIDTSPRALLQRTLDPEPVEAAPIRISIPSTRQVGLSVAEGPDGEQSPVVMFGANVLPILPSSLLGPSEQRRRMSLADYDEVSLRLTQGDVLRVEVLLEGGQTVCPMTFRAPKSALYVVTLSAENLCELVELGHSGGRVDVAFTIGDSSVGLLHYELFPAAKGDRRVAWLDVYGAIRHHTFTQPPTERYEVERRECGSQQGTLTLGVEGWKSTTLRTGPLSLPDLDQIRGLVCSPRVWLLEDEGWVAQSIENSVCRCGVGEVMSLEVTLRPSQKTTLW